MSQVLVVYTIIMDIGPIPGAWMVVRTLSQSSTPHGPAGVMQRRSAIPGSSACADY